ncbi:protein farnesyltransferase/geranylgeranyltransferase type-1 subunit alpha [Condylostylus longicornis]|uniref:protein farnesyltransferase/geranylgeranyltransferase type-1 subunit alpha n=1 Tax=Condylostylus longicornis TaxID=2530218 RepID=UPI00244E4375|nr:protein farnesyltransferase/geranylgeranyltransferase type-1 subunit alpha [Condylostylus longicornis]
MSDDSSEEDFGFDWVPYSQRKEWADVVPLKQDDGDNPVVMIAYSDRFRDVHDYFRAILTSGEKSERALNLTKDALKLNAANYTVWQYRRDILKYLQYDLNVELNYVEDVIRQNPKNYQVWHHRRVIVEWLGDASNELALTETILNMDAKNYHAWQHRQWAIKTFDLYENELTFVDRLISEDIRNNSAWNQRFFVLKHLGLTPETIEREIMYTRNRIQIVKNNESSWNYLRGILKHNNGKLNEYPEVIEFCEELFNNQVKSPYLLAFLIDLYIEKYSEDEEKSSADADKVLDLCHIMATQYDIIRKKYWEYIAGKFKKEFKIDA